MNFRACWVDAGNDPAYGKFADNKITLPYFDPRDPRITASYLDAVVKHPGITGAGFYFAWNWLPVGTTAAQFAEWCDAELRRIGWAGNALCCVDIEKGHGITNLTFVPYLVAFLSRWRQLRPKRRTDLTIEGMQGGLFSPSEVAAIMQGLRGGGAAAGYIAPSMYAGNMSPLAHDVTQDLLMSGFPGEGVVGMYDAGALPYRWRGYAFTQGRLP